MMIHSNKHSICINGLAFQAFIFPQEATTGIRLIPNFSSEQ